MVSSESWRAKSLTGMTVALSTSVSLCMISVHPASATYDRNAAAAYEDHYCGQNLGACTSYRNFIYPAYFSSDCTNFVSQALIAGGYPQVMSSFYSTDRNPYDISQFWDETSYDLYIHPDWTTWNSHTASVADDLYHHLDTAYGFGQHIGDYFLGPWYYPAPAAPDNLSTGDLLFYDWDSDGHMDHVGMKVGNGTSFYAGWNGSLVDSHTTDRYHLQWTMSEVNTNWETTTAHAVHLTF